MATLKQALVGIGLEQESTNLYQSESEQLHLACSVRTGFGSDTHCCICGLGAVGICTWLEWC